MTFSERWIEMAKRKGRHIYLLTGFIIGAVIGLLVGWVFAPVSYFDITPYSLHDDFKSDYLSIIALTYQADNDIGRARARVQELSNPIDKAQLRIIAERIHADKDLTENYDAVLSLIEAL